MAEAVCDVGDQAEAVTFWIAEKSIYSGYYDLDQVDVAPFVESADIVGLGYLSLMEDKIYCARMVFYLQPVAHILTLAIHRKRLALTDVVDEQRDELFRELIRTVVVGAVCHDGRHAVGVVICSHKVV